MATPYIMLVLLENRSYSQIVGNSNFPNVTSYANTYAKATKYYGISHPSLPNYLAILSGSTQGVTADGSPSAEGGPFSAKTFVDELTSAHIGWRAYIENLPNPKTGGNSGNYLQRHVPFMYFNSTTTTAALANVVDYTQLSSDLSAGSVPPFVWITPNANNDGHNTTDTTCDTFVKNLVNTVQASTWYTQNSGAIILLWDEGVDTDTAGIGSANPGGGQTGCIVISENSKQTNTDLTTGCNHYGLLGTLEKMYGVTKLATSATSGNGDITPMFGSATTSGGGTSPPPSQGGNPYGFTQNLADGRVLTSTEVNGIVGSGASWVRLQVSWGTVETTQTTPPTFNWTNVDASVKLAKDAGLSVLLVVQQGLASAHPPWEFYNDTCGFHNADYACSAGGYIESMAKRYNGKASNATGGLFVDAIQIGNESYDNGIVSSTMTCRLGGVTQYHGAGYFCNLAYPIIKKYSPSTQVISAAQFCDCKNIITNSETMAHNKQWAHDFLQAVKQSNGTFNCDGLDFHWYYGNWADDPSAEAEGKNPWSANSTFDHQWQAMHEICVSLGCPNMPIWCTEFNCGVSLTINYAETLTSATSAGVTSIPVTATFDYQLANLPPTTTSIRPYPASGTVQLGVGPVDAKGKVDHSAADYELALFKWPPKDANTWQVDSSYNGGRLKNAHASGESAQATSTPTQTQQELQSVVVLDLLERARTSGCMSHMLMYQVNTLMFSGNAMQSYNDWKTYTQKYPTWANSTTVTSQAFSVPSRLRLRAVQTTNWLQARLQQSVPQSSHKLFSRVRLSAKGTASIAVRAKFTSLGRKLALSGRLRQLSTHSLAAPTRLLQSARQSKSWASRTRIATNRLQTTLSRLRLKKPMSLVANTRARIAAISTPAGGAARWALARLALGSVPSRKMGGRLALLSTKKISMSSRISLAIRRQIFLQARLNMAKAKASLFLSRYKQLALQSKLMPGRTRLVAVRKGVLPTRLICQIIGFHRSLASIRVRIATQPVAHLMAGRFGNSLGRSTKAVARLRHLTVMNRWAQARTRLLMRTARALQIRLALSAIRNRVSNARLVLSAFHRQNAPVRLRVLSHLTNVVRTRFRLLDSTAREAGARLKLKQIMTRPIPGRLPLLAQKTVAGLGFLRVLARTFPQLCARAKLQGLQSVALDARLLFSANGTASIAARLAQRQGFPSTWVARARANMGIAHRGNAAARLNVAGLPEITASANITNVSRAFTDTVILWQGDTLPVVIVDTGVDLSATSVGNIALRMANTTTGSTFNGQGQWSIRDVHAGHISYAWNLADTQVPGTYQATLLITETQGRETEHPFTIVIKPTPVLAPLPEVASTLVNPTIALGVAPWTPARFTLRFGQTLAARLILQ